MPSVVMPSFPYSDCQPSPGVYALVRIKKRGSVPLYTSELCSALISMARVYVTPGYYGSGHTLQLLVLFSSLSLSVSSTQIR